MDVAVFSGVLGVTFLGRFLTPVFYVLLRNGENRLKKGLMLIYSGFRGMTFEALSDNLATAKTQRLPVVEPPALPGDKTEARRRKSAARFRSATSFC
jgi:hypothetical protein